MNTTENNKIIAEFLGYVLRGKNTFEYNNKLYLIEELKFHSDWNWLIEVVEKIESLGFNVSIEFSTCIITYSDDDFKEIIGISDNYSKIQAVYNACVAFIKWYNEQKIEK